MRDPYAGRATVSVMSVMAASPDGAGVPGAPTTSRAAYAWGALAWLLAWAAMLALDGRLDLANLGMLLVLGSTLASLWWPPLISMAASALSVLGFNWAFVPPRGSFAIDLHQHALLLATMLLVSATVAGLMARQRQIAARASRHALHATQLRELGDALRDAGEPQACASRLRESLEVLATAPTALLVLNQGLPATDDDDAAFVVGMVDADLRTGLWLCLRHSQAFGPGTGHHEDQPAWYLPMRGRSASFGAAVIVIERLPPDAEALRRQAQALCDQMGLALERSQSLRQAAQARERARIEEIRGTLLAAVSHDYRTPLAAIMSAASSLREQGERLAPAQRVRLATTIVDEADALGRMTENTLQLARLGDPARALRLDWESAEEIVGTVLRRVRRRDPARRVTARLEPVLPLLHCDALLLAQMLENLIDNALKYSGEDAPVELVVSRAGDRVVLAVRDRGPGVPPAWRERIFEAFQRGEGASGAGGAARVAGAAVAASAAGGSVEVPLAEVRRGAGVGLAVCRAIAQAHGGTLTVRARRRGGSSFECALPVALAPPPPTELPEGGTAP